MFGRDPWGGTLEISNADSATDDGRGRDLDRGAMMRHQLDETQQSWLLGPPEAKKKDRYVDLGCVVVKRKLLWWMLWVVLGAFVLIGLPIIIAKSIPKKPSRAPAPDKYTQALHKALLFFDAQKCDLTLHPSFSYFLYRLASVINYLICASWVLGSCAADLPFVALIFVVLICDLMCQAKKGNPGRK